METTDSFYTNLDFREKLGEGAYGTVNRVIFKKPYNGYTEAAAKNVLELRPEEVTILRKLDHPNINKFIALYSNGPVNIILLKYAENGSLHDFLEDQSKALPNSLRRQWSNEAALAIQYLHKCKCLHRDIKPSNCLLSKDNTLKLCDFGLAREFDRAFILSSIKGTYHYMAPEIINTKGSNQATFSTYTNIFAFGRLLLTIYTRQSPFHGMEDLQVVYQVGEGKLQPKIPEHVPNQLKDMMKKCWDVVPTSRPTIDSILQTLEKEALTGALQVLTMKNIPPVRADFIAGDIVVSRWPGYIIMAVAFSPQGHVYTVQKRSHLIRVFNERGSCQHSFSILTAHEDPSTPVYPTDAIIDNDGNLLVIDPRRGDITIHACPYGEITGHIGFKLKPIYFHIRGAVNSKKQILLHYLPQNSVYSRVVAVDYLGNELYSFTPKIDVSNGWFWPPGFWQEVWPSGMVCDSDDNVFIALHVVECSLFLRGNIKPNTGHIHKYSPTGAFLQCIDRGLFCPKDISLTQDGSSLVVANVESVLIYNPK